MKPVLLLAMLALLCSACPKKAAPVDHAKDAARCAKWSKLLRAPNNESPKACLEGMQKLAAKDPKAYACGNACIDAATDLRVLMRCMGRCPKP